MPGSTSGSAQAPQNGWPESVSSSSSAYESAPGAPDWTETRVWNARAGSRSKGSSVVRANSRAARASAVAAVDVVPGEPDPAAMEPHLAREAVRRAGVDGVEVLVDVRKRAVPVAAVVQIAATSGPEPADLHGKAEPLRRALALDVERGRRAERAEIPAHLRKVPVTRERSGGAELGRHARAQTQ